MSSGAQTQKMPLTARIARWIVKFITHIDVIGAHNIPAGGAVIANNHRSFADAPLLWVATDRQMVFMATRGVFRIPVVGSTLRRMGFISVDRSNSRNAITRQSALDKTIDAVASGLLVGMYPEGGIVDPGSALKKGVATLAKRGCPVVPAVTTGATKVLPMTGWRKWLPMPWCKVTITFYPPLQSDQVDVIDELQALFADV